MCPAAFHKLLTDAVNGSPPLEETGRGGNAQEDEQDMSLNSALGLSGEPPDHGKFDKEDTVKLPMS